MKWKRRKRRWCVSPRFHIFACSIPGSDCTIVMMCGVSVLPIRGQGVAFGIFLFHLPRKGDGDHRRA